MAKHIDRRSDKPVLPNIDIQIERWPIERLIPRANNPRTHSRAQVASIAASMREWGWTNPILVGADDDIIAGHARLLAAEKLGMKEVPVIVLSHLSPAQRRALVIADNQLAIEGAAWDEEMLRVELAILHEEDYNLDLLGFDDVELQRLLEAQDNAPGLTHADAVPEVHADPVSKPGDLWSLGNHRLICGDCTDQQVVARLLGVVLTRTLYWFQHEPCWFTRRKNAPWYGKPGSENSTIWDAPSPKFIMGGSDEEKFDHPTQKPVELMLKPIRNHTMPGEAVYEPFCGSGTTLIAAEQSGRVCYGVELDAKYIDVIIRRWQQYTGKQAVLDGDGRTFGEIAEERQSVVA